MYDNYIMMSYAQTKGTHLNRLVQLLRVGLSIVHVIGLLPIVYPISVETLSAAGNDIDTNKLFLYSHLIISLYNELY